MRTAVDTSVLLDVLGADPSFGAASREALTRCATEGSLIACDIVWAEASATYPSQSAARAALEGLGLTFSAMSIDAALRAGDVWRRYRSRGGARTRMVADFLIGAHAELHADRLLTRDRGFFRSQFSRTRIIEP